MILSLPVSSNSKLSLRKDFPFSKDSVFRGLLMASLILIPFFVSAQNDTLDSLDYDSVCLLVYQGDFGYKNMESPIPPLPANASKDEKKAHKKLIKEKQLEYYEYRQILYRYTGKINKNSEFEDRSVQSYSFLGNKYSPTIIWKSQKQMINSQVSILKTLLSNPVEQDSVEEDKPAPKMCFVPFHSIHFYKNGKVIRFYDISFQCKSVSLNGRDKEALEKHAEIAQLFEELGIPTKGQKFHEFIVDEQRKNIQEFVNLYPTPSRIKVE